MIEKITIYSCEDSIVGAIGAKLCLNAVEDYADKHGLVIVGRRDKTGKVLYWFEKRSRHENKT